MKKINLIIRNSK